MESIPDRGQPRGLMMIAGGIGHTLPYLISDFYTAPAIAAAVVVAELLAIAFIQWRYMDTPPVSGAAKVWRRPCPRYGHLIGSS
jgi:hypothetical protein